MNDKEYQNRVTHLKAEFSGDKNKDLIYQKIISFGQSLPILDLHERTNDTLVPGCQSQMYLKSILKDQKIYFYAYSDALISKGLASILIYVYSGLSPEFVLKNKPSFLEDLHLLQSLSMNRSNGALSIHERMQKDAIKFLIQRS